MSRTTLTWACFGLATLIWAALASPTWAYINGGTKRNSLGQYERTLKAEGWTVSSGAPITFASARLKEVAKGVLVVPDGNLEFRSWAGTLTHPATYALTETSLQMASSHSKSRVSQLARKAIQDAVLHEREAIEHGQFGPLECQVGAYELHTWWETKYRGKLEIHAKKCEGLVPFVAVRFRDPAKYAPSAKAGGQADGSAAREPLIAFEEAENQTAGGRDEIAYVPFEAEAPFLKKVNEPAIDFSVSESPRVKTARLIKAEHQERLSASAGCYVGWFGILRRVATKDGVTTLQLEHKYFDGFGKPGLQIVSLHGGGDFSVVVLHDAAPIPQLSLVRVYGLASKTADGGSAVAPEFIRVWTQPQFAFEEYGDDYSHVTWRKQRKYAPDRIFSPRPDHEYYYLRLGPHE